MSLRLTRREFMQGAAGASIAVLAAPLAAQEKRVPVIDTHLHCFAGKGDSRFPYHPKGPFQPEKAATPEHLLTCMAGAGVDYSVVVHPEPYQDDHRYLDHCFAVCKDKVKGTCLYFAEQPGSIAAMQALVKKYDKKIFAARIHAHAADRLPPFGKPELKAFWAAAGELGLAIQLHFVPKYAPGFEQLIQNFSKTMVIIDHLGRPFQGTEAEHDVVVRWSRFPNTVLKISALPDPQQFPDRPLAPVVRKLTDAFGPDRLIYGGGFNDEATPESYRAYRERVRALIAHFSTADQAKVFGGNAARLFDFPASV